MLFGRSLALVPTHTRVLHNIAFQLMQARLPQYSSMRSCEAFRMRVLLTAH